MHFFVCVYVYVYVCMYVVYMYVYVCMNVCVCTYVVCMFVCVCTYACMYGCIYLCVRMYVYIYKYILCMHVCIYVCMKNVCIFYSLHAPLLGIILHALLWYLQIQCLEISTLIVSYYEISLIYLMWFIYHFVYFVKRILVSKFNKYFKMYV